MLVECDEGNSKGTMIFALADWFKYRLRRGVYGDDPSKNIMAIGHEGQVAPETLELIEEGDIIICQRMDSAMSWAVTYFGGGYAIDHVAIYVGNEEVLHTTFSGTKIQALRALARGARILPFRPYWLDEDGRPTEQRPPSPAGTSPTEKEGQVSDDPRPDGGDQPTLPPHLQLLLVGLQIVFGLRPTSFRWRYYADVGFCAAIIDFIADLRALKALTWRGRVGRRNAPTCRCQSWRRPGPITTGRAAAVMRETRAGSRLCRPARGKERCSASLPQLTRGCRALDQADRDRAAPQELKRHRVCA